MGPQHVLARPYLILQGGESINNNQSCEENYSTEEGNICHQIVDSNIDCMENIEVSNDKIQSSSSKHNKSIFVAVSLLLICSFFILAKNSDDDAYFGIGKDYNVSSLLIKDRFSSLGSNKSTNFTSLYGVNI